MLRKVASPFPLNKVQPATADVAGEGQRPARCRICRGPESLPISLALVKGEPLRAIEARTGYSKPARQRHKAHIPPDLLAALKTREAADAATLVEDLLQLKQHVKAIRV